MSVRTTYAGRTGNNLFQYVYARMFAEYQNLQLLTPWPHQHFIKTTPEKKGRTLTGKRNEYRDTFRRKFAWHHKAQYPGGWSTFDGYWQWHKWYEGEEQRILSYFDLPQVQARPDDVLCHFRLGDYFQVCGGSVIDPSWYIEILNSLGVKKFYCMTDDPYHPYFDAFEGFEMELIHQAYMKDFHDMRGFGTILIANSSFSWWAAYLGRAQGMVKKVYSFEPWMKLPRGEKIDLAHSFTPIPGKFYEQQP